MKSVTDHQTLAHVAGAAGIVGQFAAAFPFLLIPLLIVPTPAMYAFFVAWGALLVLAIAWWRHHPWRSFLVPIVSVPAVYLALELGQRALGWGRDHAAFSGARRGAAPAAMSAHATFSHVGMRQDLSLMTITW